MKFKRFLTAALSIAMLSGIALAADTTATELPVGPGPAEMPKFEVTERIGQPVYVWGSAKELGENRILLENSNENDPYSQIVLNVSDETIILDAVTGAEKTFADLKENENLQAYVSSAMTRSIPPQTHAILILCNIPADYIPPRYDMVQKVTQGEDGKVSALMSGSVVLHMNEKTELLSYKTKDIPTLADIEPGTMLLSWYSVVALSMPAQANPTKVMVFPSAFDGYVSAAPGSLAVNGEAVELATQEAPFVHAGKLMVPVRKLAEALGATVTWNAATPDAVTVERDGAHLYTITIGADTLTREGDMVLNVTTPAQVRDRVTFVCLDDVLAAHGLKYEVVSYFG